MSTQVFACKDRSCTADVSKQYREQGTVNPNKVPVYNSKGYLCGSCGPNATETVAARLSGERGHVLGKKEGRTAWIIPQDRANVTAAFSAGRDGGRAASLRAAKGSNK